MSKAASQTATKRWRQKGGPTLGDRKIRRIDEQKAKSSNATRSKPRGQNYVAMAWMRMCNAIICWQQEISQLTMIIDNLINYNWKGFIESIPSDLKLHLYYFETITWCNLDSVDFTVNLMQERVFINRFYRINHTKTYNFYALTLVTSASHKIAMKMRYSLPKIPAFDEEPTLRHTFLSSDLQCLPPGDPRILCA